MELPILLLQDSLNQQKEQLNDCEKRNTNPDAPAFEFRNKAIKNLKRFIAELEEGINVLTLANKQKEAFSIQGVGSSNNFKKTLVSKEGGTFFLTNKEVEFWEKNGDIKTGDILYRTVTDTLY